MKLAMDAAVATLPEPVSSAHVQSIAESILRTAKHGERYPQRCKEWRYQNYRSRGVIDGIQIVYQASERPENQFC